MKVIYESMECEAESDSPMPYVCSDVCVSCDSCACNGGDH